LDASAAVGAAGGCVVALRRWLSSKELEFSPTQMARAIDAEIDMRRPPPHRSAIAHNVSRLLRWMLPEGNSIGPPMRSVAREIEEIFPSDDK
jgi:hypothetical protein